MSLISQPPSGEKTHIPQIVWAQISYEGFKEKIQRWAEREGEKELGIVEGLNTIQTCCTDALRTNKMRKLYKYVVNINT